MNIKNGIDNNLPPLLSSNIIELNNTKSYIGEGESFLTLFLEISENNKDIAVVFENQSISYEDLNALSNQFSHYFINNGIKPGSLVGVCLERNINLIAAVLGILKAGACYIPLDPNFPESRLSYMIKDSGLEFIVSSKELSNYLSGEPETKFILIDPESDSIREEKKINPEINIFGDMLSYVIYTSGSTGKPKGVQIQHLALLNFLLSMKKKPGISKQDRILALTTLSFDISGLEIYLPLISGATVVLVSSDTAKDGAMLIDYIEKHKVSVMQATPATYQMIFDLNWKNRTVKKLLCGGEAMSIDLANKLQVSCGEVWNMYGPTETTIWSSVYRLHGQNQKPLIGRPIDNTVMILLDEGLNPVVPGEEGELYIGGMGLSKGYLNHDDLTAGRFIPCVFSELDTSRLYKTGDICRYTGDWNIEYLGRADFQVKIRGFRIELGEIENNILLNSAVANCVVTVREDIPGFKKLVAYIVEKEENKFSSVEIRKSLKNILPDYMIPESYVVMKSFPLTPNNKIDRKALPKPGKNRPELSNQYAEPQTETEKIISKIWSELLAIDKVGIEDNFFDLGGNSLLGVRVINILLNKHNLNLPIIKLFEFPTIKKLAGYFDGNETGINILDLVNERATYQRIGRFVNDPLSDGVAIIGMAGRFPGAENLDQLWKNLCDGVESISRFTKDELGPGIDEDLINDPDYVPARGIVNNADKFDASFFGISPSEAKIMDPQQRVFLELAYHSLENAGYDPESYKGMIGVYAGAGDNYYYTANVIHHSSLIKMVGQTVVGYGNFKDYIALRASYHLNLTGPGVSLNTACSTTLLAVDSAFQALINYECDMALAGGVDIFVPQKSGFLYQVNGTFARDGHCRPFDCEATGTMFCDGAGIVVLKRLKDAIQDRDKIYAVIRGSAKNNDGANKASFLAPSSEGQSKVIAMAQALANVSSEDIGYIEAHGTGTPVGDPIEVDGLTKAFRLHTNKNQFCYLGSIKGNIGHSTNAAGIAGLIKTTLCLYHEKIPGTLHFKTPLPDLNIENTPFVIVDKLTEWKRENKTRIAGVSAFGFGGTNVHTIIGESPVQAKPSVSKRHYYLFPVSAKTKKSLDDLTANYITFFSDSENLVLPDISYTLKTGRKNHAFRRFVVADNIKNAVKNFMKLEPAFSNENYCEEKNKKICFMFPGQGSQYSAMGRNLYDSESFFRETVDSCVQILGRYLEKDIHKILFNISDNGKGDPDLSVNTPYSQVAIFIIEYALSRLLMNWGIQPSVMIGHSVGEFVCAALSGIFSLEDALYLVALRGRLIEGLPNGSMLTIGKGIKDIELLVPAGIQLAADNSPDICIVAGPDEQINSFHNKLENKGIICKKLPASHAFHSKMMDPVIDVFTGSVRKIKMSVPSVPFLSTISNSWINADNPTTPEYWGFHMRHPVLFSDSIDKLLNENKYLFLEVGPGTTMSTLTRQHPNSRGKAVISTLTDSSEENEESRALEYALGNLWLHGVSIDWKAYYKDENRYKTPLPLYPFEKISYWVDPPAVIPDMSVQARSSLSDLSFKNEKTEKVQHKLYDENSIVDSLTEMISGVFGHDIKKFGQETMFIEMGMDSLFLTQVSYKLGEQFNIKITFGQLLKDYPNIKLLAAYLIEQTAHNDEAVKMQDERSTPVLKKSAFSYYNATFEQKAFVKNLQSSIGSSPAMNDSVTIQFFGNVDYNQLKKSFILLTKKHEALRSYFDESGNKIIIQEINDPDIFEHDLTIIPPEQVNDRFIKIYAETLDRKLDIHNEALCRAVFVKLPRNRINILISCHASVCDSWAFDVIIADFVSIYNNLDLEQPVSTKVDYNYSNYLIEQSNNGDPNTIRNSLAYWIKEMENLPALKFLANDLVVKENKGKASRLDLILDCELAVAVKNFARSNSTSLFTVLFAAFSIVLSKIYQQNVFSLAHLIADQSILNKPDLVGNCGKLMPFLVKIDPALNFIDYVKEVQLRLAEHFEYCAYPIDQLIHSAGLTNNSYNTYDIPVVVNHTKIYDAHDIHNESFGVSYYINPRSFTNTNLLLNFVEFPDGLEFYCTINRAAFKMQETIVMLNLLGSLISQFCNNNKIKIRDFAVESNNNINNRIIDQNADNFYSFISGTAVIQYPAKINKYVKLLF